MDITMAIPAGWRTPRSEQVAHAKAFACTALADSGDWPVSGRLARYYELRGNYAGSTFTHLQDRHPSADARRVTVADLHAVSLLSVTVPPAATRALIDNTDGHAETVNATLAALDDHGVRHLRDACPEVLAAMEDVMTAMRDACASRAAKVSNPWVVASKLAARKVPGLFPVRDNVVCTALGLMGRGKPKGSWRIDWQVYQRLMLDTKVRGAIDAAQNQLNARDPSLYGHEPDGLRILDAALWTHEIWRLQVLKKSSRAAT